MKAIVVSDGAAGTAGMKLVDRPDPAPAGNDVLVEVHASRPWATGPRGCRWVSACSV
jgi:hypothetical protein